MNEGKDVHTLMREIQLPPELEVGQGYGTVPVERARHLGDLRRLVPRPLHARSSTTCPPWSVHPDLVELAGGPDAVAARARERLERGEAVSGCGLSDAGADGHSRLFSV